MGDHTELTMLVGIPGSGKSTVAGRFAEQGHRIHATDAIREELFGGEEIRGRASEVYALLRERVLRDLGQGCSCVIDATNLTVRRRLDLLQHFVRLPIRRRCVLLCVPIEECLRRNEARSRTVPNSAVDRLLQSFGSPYYNEGWDEIEVVRSGEPYRFPFDAALTFRQDNPYHALTLGEHMRAAEDYCRAHGFSEEVCEAARYHDCGKLYTRRYGKEDGIAHYYGHEGYSGYLYLCEMAGRGLCEGEALRRTLYIASLIGAHMLPLQFGGSAQRHERLRRQLGPEMYAELMQLHEADRSAHGRTEEKAGG